MRRLGRFLVLCSLLLAAGCVSTTTHIDPMSPLPPNKRPGQVVSSRACGFMLLGFLPIRTWSRNWRAYELLKRKARRGVLADVEVRESWSYAFIGTKYCTTMNALVYKEGRKRRSSRTRERSYDPYE